MTWHRRSIGACPADPPEGGGESYGQDALGLAERSRRRQVDIRSPELRLREVRGERYGLIATPVRAPLREAVAHTRCQNAPRANLCILRKAACASAILSGPG